MGRPNKLALDGPIRRARLARGWTLATLAEVVGRSIRNVWKWEVGRALPSPDSLDLLRAALEDELDGVEARRVGSRGLDRVPRSTWKASRKPNTEGEAHGA